MIVEQSCKIFSLLRSPSARRPGNPSFTSNVSLFFSSIYIHYTVIGPRKYCSVRVDRVEFKSNRAKTEKERGRISVVTNNREDGRWKDDRNTAGETTPACITSRIPLKLNEAFLLSLLVPTARSLSLSLPLFPSLSIYTEERTA